LQVTSKPKSPPLSIGRYDKIAEEFVRRIVVPATMPDKSNSNVKKGNRRRDSASPASRFVYFLENRLRIARISSIRQPAEAEID
jgi:hypothetical protein